MTKDNTQGTDPTSTPQIARQQYDLSRDRAQELYDLSAPAYAAGASSTAMLDPVYIDAVNQFWMREGQEQGFKWSTVDQAEFDHDHYIGNVSACHFWAESETALPDDTQAHRWLADMVVTGNAATLKNRDLVLRAFAAGRAKGFAMGAACPSDAPARLQEWIDKTEWLREEVRKPGFPVEHEGKHPADVIKAVHDWLADTAEMVKDALIKYAPQALFDEILPVASGNSNELPVARRLLTEAAALFREYEAHHRAKVPGNNHADDRLRKAERNAGMAQRIETFLDGWTDGVAEMNEETHGQEDRRMGFDVAPKPDVHANAHWDDDLDCWVADSAVKQGDPVYLKPSRTAPDLGPHGDEEQRPFEREPICPGMEDTPPSMRQSARAIDLSGGVSINIQPGMRVVHSTRDNRDIDITVQHETGPNTLFEKLLRQRDIDRRLK